MKQRVLFINEDMAYWRAGLASEEPAAQGWEFLTADTPAEARRLIGGGSVHAVVANYLLPEHSGLGFLDELGRDYPALHRFVRADTTAQSILIKCLGTPHRILARNAAPQEARTTVHRALTAATWLPSEQTRTLLAAMSRLPSPPDLYFRIVQEMQSDYGSIDSVTRLVSQDPALSAKLLQAANSASFGLHSPISHPGEAIAHFGIEAVKSMVLLSHSFSYFDDVRSPSFSVEALWAHSLTVGRLALWIARGERAPREVCDTAFTAGLLHDLGKLVFSANFPARFSKALTLQRDAALPVCEAEVRVFGAGHPDIGAGLFSVWGLPPAIVEAVALHHHPVRLNPDGFCAVTAVHAADALAWELNGQALMPSPSRLDRDYLGSLGLQDRLDEWRDGCASVLHDPDR